MLPNTARIAGKRKADADKITDEVWAIATKNIKDKNVPTLPNSPEILKMPGSATLQFQEKKGVIILPRNARRS